MSPENKRTSQEDRASGRGDHPFKKTRLSSSSPGGDEAAVLGRHLDEALDFINSCGLASSTTPNLTCPHILACAGLTCSLQKHPNPSSPFWNPAPTMPRARHNR